LVHLSGKSKFYFIFIRQTHGFNNFFQFFWHFLTIFWQFFWQFFKEFWQFFSGGCYITLGLICFV
jgi:hypothetical protein